MYFLIADVVVFDAEPETGTSMTGLCQGKAEEGAVFPDRVGGRRSGAARQPAA